LKHPTYIIATLLIFLFACSSEKRYKISGDLTNLSDQTLYAVYETGDINIVDTVVSDSKGVFNVEHNYIDNLLSIAIYYDNKDKWFVVYPEKGKSITVKGDADYPELLQIKGGRVNNKLNDFRKKATVLLKAIADINRSSENGADVSQTANLNLELKRIAMDFIRSNPKEEASAIMIAEYFNKPDEMKIVEDLLDVLSPDLSDFFIVKNLRQQIEKAKKTEIGVEAPDFNLKDIYGKPVALDSFANKYLILAFTAFWCDMCQTEMMMLDHYNNYSKDSLDILLISLDEDLKDVKEQIHQDTIKWNLVIDSAGQAINIFNEYNVNSVPKIYLMDKEGKIILKTSNGMELRKTVEDLLK
jgi:peroxiredoxin